jgi:hypothetical protein
MLRGCQAKTIKLISLTGRMIKVVGNQYFRHKPSMFPVQNPQQIED